MPTYLRPKDVFLNCPFDDSYRPIFEAVIFTIYYLGFIARCALEVDDASELRFSKICRIVEQCALGIHDISSVGLSSGSNLPRFNMPFELGLYLGCQLFGPQSQRKKGCLILDSEPFRYRTSISDLSGQDIHAHHGQPELAVKEVRNWLSSISQTKGLPGGAEIVSQYAQFKNDLPKICEDLKRHPQELTFADFLETVEMWLNQDR